MTLKAARRLEILNEKGLHARASAKFVEAAERFEAEAQVSKDGLEVPATSIMGLMMLAAAQGSHIDIRAVGPDAPALIEAVADLVESKFGELR